MKPSIKEHNNDMMITQENIAIIYSHVTYKPSYEQITGLSFNELTEQTIEVLGGIRTKLQIGESREQGTQIEQRKYKFPGQKGELEASTVIRTPITNHNSNTKPHTDIELIVGLYDFDKESPFYNKLVQSMTDLQRYKKQTLIYNWLID